MQEVTFLSPAFVVFATVTPYGTLLLAATYWRISPHRSRPGDATGPFTVRVVVTCVRDMRDTGRSAHGGELGTT